MMLPAKIPERGALTRVWKEFNKLRDYVHTLRPIAGKNIQVDRTANGSVIRGKPGGAASITGEVSIGMFSVSVINAATLTCYYVGDVDLPGANVGSSETITVAKPAWLRARDCPTFAGQPYTYSADESDPSNKYGQRIASWNTGTSFLQWKEHIFPPYESTGSYLRLHYIFAAYVGEAQTGITGVDWIDVNVDARTWRVVMKEFGVCMNGLAQHVAIAGGLP